MTDLTTRAGRIAALKAGMDRETARKYAKLGKLPSQSQQQAGMRRQPHRPGLRQRRPRSSVA
mgnify:CR=1 FL=1